MVKRGSIFVVALSGEYQKPRPALVVQNNRSSEFFESVTICLLTSDVQFESKIRVCVEPSLENGLRKASHVQCEKIQSVPKKKLGAKIGNLSVADMQNVDLAIAFHLDLFAQLPAQEETL